MSHGDDEEYDVDVSDEFMGCPPPEPLPFASDRACVNFTHGLMLGTGLHIGRMFYYSGWYVSAAR